MALKLMNTQWEGAPAKWWELLPLKLTEYQACDHLRRMLQENATVTRSTFTKTWNPATGAYESIPEQPAQVAPREARETRTTAAGQVCSKPGCGWQPKTEKKKTKNNRFNVGLCPTCYRDKMKINIALKREKEQQQQQPVSEPLATGRTALESSPLSNANKSLGGCAGLKNSMFFLFIIHKGDR